MTVERIVVIGAGTMGNGIAQTAAVSGYQVTMTDVDEAALERGKAARLATKPGESFASTGSLPILRPTSKTRSRVASEVSKPRMTSSRDMSGTGLKKCMPMIRSGREVAPTKGRLGDRRDDRYRGGS